MTTILLIALLAAGVAAMGCSRQGASSQPVGSGQSSFSISSPAFGVNQTIPKAFTGEGEDVNPPLVLGAPPERTKELTLIVDDPDAPAGIWTHWLLYKIPPQMRSIGSMPDAVGVHRVGELGGALQGKNSSGRLGYQGPMPPRGHGVHHYRFRLYALDAELPAINGLEREALLAAMQGHILAQAEWVGIYERK